MKRPPYLAAVFTSLVALSGALPLIPTTAQACSRILWNDNGQSIVVARTVDLYRSDEAKMVASPRGIEREGLAGENSLKWKSKYGSIAITAFDRATSDGINEEGLAVNLLYLAESKYEKREAKPGVANILWAQYTLDNYKTVKEALEGFKTIQIVPMSLADREWPLHLSIADASGDSAVIEFIDGKMVVHHGKEFTVMTNEPALDIQLANLKKYKLFGGDLPMPGDIDPLSRFVRASSYLKTLPKPTNYLETLAGVYSVARTVAVPYGAEDTSNSGGEDTWPTLWFSIADLPKRIYYFQSTKTPNLFWVDLNKLQLSEGSPVHSVDAYDPTLEGEVSARLSNVQK